MRISRDFDVYEKVKFDCAKDQDKEVEIIKGYLVDELVFIATNLLRSRGWINHLKLHVDDKEYFFTGREITPEYKKIIRALREAEKAELEIYYSYTGEYDEGPFPLVLFLYQLHREGKTLEGVDLSLYYLDMSEGVDRGHLAIYGERDGKRYAGEVAFKEILEIPEDAEWHVPMSGILIEGVAYPPQNKEAIQEVAERLISIGHLADKDCCEFDIDDESVFINFSSPILYSPEEVYAYAAEASKLEALFIDPETGEGEDIPVTLEFFSDAGDIPRMLSIETKIDGSYVMRMASDE